MPGTAMVGTGAMGTGATGGIGVGGLGLASALIGEDTTRIMGILIPTTGLTLTPIIGPTITPTVIHIGGRPGFDSASDAVT